MADHAAALAWAILAAAIITCLTLLATEVRRASRAIDHAIDQAAAVANSGTDAAPVDDWRLWEAEMGTPGRHRHTRRPR